MYKLCFPDGTPIGRTTVEKEPAKLDQKVSTTSVTLPFQRVAVTLRTTRFNIKKFYVVPTLRLCVLYGSQNKQQLLPYKASRDWFL
jgi:hypothetical protein